MIQMLERTSPIPVFLETCKVIGSITSQKHQSGKGVLPYISLLPLSFSSVLSGVRIRRILWQLLLNFPFLLMSRC